jgi:hypothetical protein
MVEKKLLLPDRLRQIPSTGYSWLDRRFVREGFLATLEPSVALLYFFLSTVGDAQGLSFWGDSAIARLLRCTSGIVVGARDRLRAADLVAYRHPLYQILSLPPVAPPASTAPPGVLPAPRKRGGVLTGSPLFVAAVASLHPQPTHEVRP